MPRLTEHPDPALDADFQRAVEQFSADAKRIIAAAIGASEEDVEDR